MYKSLLMARKQRFWLAVLLIGLLVLTAVLLFGPRVKGVYQSFTYERALRGAVSCSVAGADVISCARGYVQSMMELRSAKNVLDSFSNSVAPLRCHYLGHIVGQELYRTYQNDALAIAQCSNACELACGHGVIGEAFISTAGISDEDFDPSHLGKEELVALGKRLCTSGSCHGVGHAFYQAYHNLDEALVRCSETVSGVQEQRCSRGVFMEYSNIFSARSVWEAAPVTPNVEDLYSTCTEFTGVGKEACYFYLPGVILGVVQREQGELPAKVKIETLLRICDNVPENDRMLCVSGVGVHFYSYLVLGSSEARNICESFDSKVEKASCAFGMLSMSMESGRLEEKFTYCRALADRSVQGSCFQSIFTILRADKGAVENARPLCNADALCLFGADRAFQNPFDYIVETVE